MLKPPQSPPPDSLEAEYRRRRDHAIAAFAEEFLPGENQALYQQMLLTLCRLNRDQASRADIKLLGKSLAEMRYALKVFAPYRHIRKISIFGSARTPEQHPDYQQAERFAKLVSESGWMVITGAGDGIMKAGHGGAGREASFGVAIRLPFEQHTNNIIADDEKLVSFRYFFTRKLVFIKEASAVALFPGGFGTLDEGFEALTLIQTGKANLVPIVLCEQEGGDYWHHWRQYVVNELLAAGMISENDMHLFRIFDNAEQAAADVIQFYRVYHSMRFVGDTLVLRLERPLSDRTLERLNTEFKHVMLSGKIEQTRALPEEAREFEEKPRLALHFDRHSYGLLRRMIDVINQEP